MSLFVVLPLNPRQIWESEWLSSSQTDHLSPEEVVVYFPVERKFTFRFLHPTSRILMTLLQTKSYEYNKYHSFVENIKQELNKCY